MAADAFHIDTGKKKNNLLIALPIFAVAAGILIFAKANANGFNIMWRYFAWSNECIAVFAFAMISVYMIRHKMPYLMALLPGMFYMFVVSSYILNAKIGFNLPWAASHIASGVITVGFGIAVVLYGRKK